MEAAFCSTERAEVIFFKNRAVRRVVILELKIQHRQNEQIFCSQAESGIQRNKLMKTSFTFKPFASSFARWPRCWILAVAFLGMMSRPGFAQLFENLKAFGNRLPVGYPAVTNLNRNDGPKGIAVADLDNDNHPDIAVAGQDGSVTIYFGQPAGKFSAPLYLQTGARELRGIVCADYNGDGLPDIVVASPYAGNAYLFMNQGGRSFGSATTLGTWPGARALAAGDFDGDGKEDLAIAGPGSGLRHLRGLGNGSFDLSGDITILNGISKTFPQPYYFMSPFRPRGATRDELVVTHDETNLIWVLASGTNNVLEIQGAITNEFAHSLDVGAITQPQASGTLDLVTAQLDRGTVTVHPGSNGPARFGQAISQTISVPGGPRAVKIADLDGDGWNDLIVVLRNFDRVLTYHNSNGVLVAATETPVGVSPRELVVADFNSDGHPDLAVMNRDSKDVSVLLTYPGKTGFSILDQTYPVDGDVADLIVKDLNHDGRDDVLQLHRASSEFSVRFANPDGTLGPPTFYSMGNLPNQMTLSDVDNDGIPDALTVNLGRTGVENGSLSVRKGNADGTFGPENRTFIPGEEGRFYAIVAADFDNDGYVDLAVGFFDCRIVFFKNNGDGTFTKTGDHEHLFVYEARGMIAGDFNQDGFIDLAGVGFYGSLVVVENHGDIMTTPYLEKVQYEPRCCGGSQAGSVRLVDENHDGDPDILITSSLGTTLYLGGPGSTFTLASHTSAQVNLPASSLALGDFDGDGREDMAVACRVLSCISILTKNANGDFIPALSVNVPAGGFLATGDLDGDGKPDLVGSGSVLWTALSSRRAQNTPPRSENAGHVARRGAVFNEILASNDVYPVPSDGGRLSDWIELYNNSGTNLNLLGWHLKLVKAADTNGSNVVLSGWVTNDFAFTNNIVFTNGAYLLVICTDKIRSPLHTGFKIPAAGGILSLIDSNGLLLDKVQYPPQDLNVSYSRYRDGVDSWVFNEFPSPGRANVDNGSRDPVVKFQGLDLNTLQANRPLEFTATGQDDIGLVGVSLVYRRLDIQDNEIHRVPLYDDGLHHDLGMLDGAFAGVLEGGLPQGAEIEFYLECMDLTDKTITVPEDAAFALPGEPIRVFSMVVGGTHPAIEISEVVAGNKTGLHDEVNGTPPWLEIRNCSPNPVPLQNVSLASKYFDTGPRLDFTNGQVLLPGEHMVIFCDDKPAQGANHAPFNLSKNGDHAVLTSFSTNGARVLVDALSFGAQSNDVAYSRLDCGGPWVKNTPTPFAQNIAGTWLGVANTNGTFTFAFPTVKGKSYLVEYATSLESSLWTGLPPIVGDGIEKSVTQPTGTRRFYRVSTH
ncbi:MAG: hypothetical protein JWM16_694 [Verrucomicrobiales bacterium]|nr:hypothetical protein [Verrucomicrobiales bacterium]